MQEPSTILEPGTRIRTHTKLGDTLGMMVALKHREARQADTDGVVYGVVPAHGGDVYWVRHEGVQDCAAYCWDEFELLEGE